MDRHPCSCFRGWDYENRTAILPSDSGDICCNCGGIVPPKGGYKSRSESSVNLPDSRIKEYAKKAWDHYMDYEEEEALHYINMALDLDDKHADNWNIKAIILEGMKRYAESEKCYNRSLELSPENLVYDNKARMLHDWAVQLLEKSKKQPNGLNMLDDAYDKVIKAMKALPGENSEEDLEKYLKLRDSINFCIDHERKYQRNLEALKKYDKDELFTITGMHLYENDVTLTPGKPLRLVKEPDNEFDRDAIAVYAEDEKIGYIANNDNTKFELTSAASKLQDRIETIAQGSYLFYLGRYADNFPIGRIVKQNNK